jgi:type II secretory pathway pseudopilin PulG
MNTKHTTCPSYPASETIRGMTIIELSVALGLMLSMASIVVMSANGITDWKRARDAGMELRSVYIAQKSYLADNPTQSVTSITAGTLTPYLPVPSASMPTVESLTGAQLPINFNVIPPVVKNGTATYDPSGVANDGLWDVGKP